MDKKIAEKLLEETRLSKKRTEKLERIDSAAIELFSKKGYANTTSKEIAELAQVAEGTIFRHYGTKENLLVRILIRFINVLIPLVKNEFINDISKQSFETLEEFTYFFVSNRLSFVMKNPGLFKVFVKEMVYDDALRSSIITKYTNDATTILHGIFDSLRQKGQLEGISNSALSERLLKTFLPEFVWMFVLTDGYKTMDEQEWIKETVKRFIKGI